MFMRTILALSLAASVLAVPVAQPQLSQIEGEVESTLRGWFCLSNTQCYKTDLMI
jgi:hypothetical protein